MMVCSALLENNKVCSLETRYLSRYIQVSPVCLSQNRDGGNAWKGRTLSSHTWIMQPSNLMTVQLKKTDHLPALYSDISLFTPTLIGTLNTYLPLMPRPFFLINSTTCARPYTVLSFVFIFYVFIKNIYSYYKWNTRRLWKIQKILKSLNNENLSFDFCLHCKSLELPAKSQYSEILATIQLLGCNQILRYAILLQKTEFTAIQSIPSRCYRFTSDMASKNIPGASLVAQWLRICLPMQGTRVRALVWEDPTCRGATGPVSHNY